MWQHLIETALMGTGTKTLNPEMFPVHIRDFLNERNAEPEEVFLETSALCCLYLEAGFMPAKLNGEIDDRIIEETQSIGPDPLNNLINQLDDVNTRIKEKLFNLWLDILIRKQYIVSPEIVVKLLFACNGFSNETKSKVTKVVGNKGNWIVSLHPGLQYSQKGKNENIWTEGNINERKSTLLKLLEIDPASAIDMLKSTWKDEPLVNKRAFVEILKNFPAPPIVNFAQELYNNDFTYRSKEKKTEKECRKIVAEILLGVTESDLHRSTTEKLFNYFSGEKKKSLLGLITKSQLEYKLPGEEDSSFWDADNMEQVFGLEVKNYDIAAFKTINQYWLSYFLEVISVDAWTKECSDSYNEFLNCFIGKDDFVIKNGDKKQPVFLGAILLNTIKFKNNPLSMLFLAKMQPANVLPLLKNLTKEQFEQYVSKNKYFTDEEILENGPFGLDESWSLSFSENILDYVYETIQTNWGKLNSLGQVIAQYIHSDAGKNLDQNNFKLQSSAFFNQWKNGIFEPVNNVLKIKKIIKSHNT